MSFFPYAPSSNVDPINNMYVFSRRPNLIDLFIPKLEGISSYIIKHAPNWDEDFEPLDTIPIIGKASATVRAPETGTNGGAIKGWVRYRMAPSDFDIPDDNVLFFKIGYMSGEDEVYESEIFMVLSSSFRAEMKPLLVLRGDIPAAENADEALRLTFPVATESLNITNLGGQTVLLSFAEEDVEIPILGGASFGSVRNMRVSKIKLRTETGSPSTEVLITALPLVHK